MTPAEVKEAIHIVYETIFLVLVGFGLGYQARRYFETKGKQ